MSVALDHGVELSLVILTVLVDFQLADKAKRQISSEQASYQLDKRNSSITIGPMPSDPIYLSGNIYFFVDIFVSY